MSLKGAHTSSLGAELELFKSADRNQRKLIVDAALIKLQTAHPTLVDMEKGALRRVRLLLCLSRQR